MSQGTPRKLPADMFCKKEQKEALKSKCACAVHLVTSRVLPSAQERTTTESQDLARKSLIMVLATIRSPPENHQF